MEPKQVIDTALQYKAKDEFIVDAITRIEQTVVLSPAQVVGLKYVGKLAVGMSIEEILAYVSTGTWQEVGLDAIVSEALTEEQRVLITNAVVDAAKAVIQAQIANLQQVIA